MTSIADFPDLILSLNDFQQNILAEAPTSMAHETQLSDFHRGLNNNQIDFSQAVNQHNDIPKVLDLSYAILSKISLISNSCKKLQKISEDIQSIINHIFTCVQKDSPFNGIEVKCQFPKPNTPHDVDQVIHTIVQLKHLLREDCQDLAYQLLANWVDQHNLALGDLGIPEEEFTQLVPFLKKLNFTQSKSNPQAIAMLIEHCPNLEELTFQVYAGIDQTILDAISQKQQLKKLHFFSCNFNHAKLDCTDLLNLSYFRIYACDDVSSPLDFSKCAQLNRLEVIRLQQFNDQIILPKGDKNQLEFASFEQLREWNQPIDLSHNHSLKSLQFVSNKIFNHPVDLGSLSELKSVNIKCCNEWKGPLILKENNSLEMLTLNDCRDFQGEIDLHESPKLTHLHLCNCREFSTSLDVQSCTDLQSIQLINCFKLKQTLDLSDHKRLNSMHYYNSNQLSIITPRQEVEWKGNASLRISNGVVA